MDLSSVSCISKSSPRRRAPDTASRFYLPAVRSELQSCNGNLIFPSAGAVRMTRSDVDFKPSRSARKWTRWPFFDVFVVRSRTEIYGNQGDVLLSERLTYLDILPLAH